jgi:hypothetical protein
VGRVTNPGVLTSAAFNRHAADRGDGCGTVNVRPIIKTVRMAGASISSPFVVKWATLTLLTRWPTHLLVRHRNHDVSLFVPLQ